MDTLFSSIPLCFIFFEASIHKITSLRVACPRAESLAEARLALQDVWSDVSAANVTQASVSNILDADYGDYNAADNKIRACIFNKGFAVRDLVINIAQMLGIAPSCDAIYLYKCGSATA